MTWTRSIWTFALLALIAACGGETAEPAVETPGTGTTAGVTAPTDSATLDAAGTQQKLNLNTASEAELLAVPGSSERMAHEFEEYRPYVSIQQFRREIGKYVDEAAVAAYEQYLFVPVDPNESDAPTLQQIPGVTEAMAQELIAARPYASRQAFLDRLAEGLTPEQRAQAESYVPAE